LLLTQADFLQRRFADSASLTWSTRRRRSSCRVSPPKNGARARRKSRSSK